MSEAYKTELKDGIWSNVKQMAKDDPAIITDVAGIFDPTGAADLTSAGIRAVKGDWWGALFSAVSAVPFGDLIGKSKLLARYGPKGAKLGGAIASYFGKSAKALQESLVGMKGAKAAIAARKRALEKVREAMKKKRAKKNCAECKKVPNGRMPANGKNGNWTDAAGNKIAQPADGNGFFKFSETKTLPDGTKVDGIAYKDGFPDFDKYVVGGKQDISVVSGEVGADARTLQKEFGIRNPDAQNYVLHHFEDGQVGYIPKTIHNTTNDGVAHVGGASMIDSQLF
ncbi:hypothetical protein GGE43_005263 [Agrobacterium tumefaciens]|jgi:hypothetical protein|uniref:Uncharacterized protein n=1 Tax=Agrobacterium radiobacter TaxID=362 RepID=A0ABR6JEQ1_AGRRD|nr:hypothetical protein [Agrobacterium radiobacter]TGE78292.1 hypothetical protein C9410_16075 [Rhizobium sp. SEMIA 439]MBB4283626.1 hypothetical protein [Agrobacterium radiobacter]MBB4321492.1 hypothetical protein [Agrobacterium radiobacter]MBB4325557.1 hypothetical protein [Agrobacterium radiobacter]MBB4338531.1 hypothetical protein [Agrobacterium radiobacter]